MSNKYDRETLLFMSEVDQAMYGKGHKLAYVMSTAILLLIVIFIIWASLAMLDERTRGFGRVIPSQRIQEIQNLEGGILNELFVREGQNVEKGDILARLSNEQAASYYRDAYSKALEHKAAIARLQAEADGTDPVFPDDVLKEAPQLAEDQLRIFKAQRDKLEIEVSLLEDQYQQRQQEVNEMVGRRRQLRQSLQVAERQRDIAKPLVEKQIHSELDYLRLEQTVVQMRGDVEALSLGIPPRAAGGQGGQGPHRPGQGRVPYPRPGGDQRAQAGTQVDHGEPELRRRPRDPYRRSLAGQGHR